MILLAIQQQKRKKSCHSTYVQEKRKKQKIASFFPLFPEKTNLKSDTTK